MKWLLEKYQQVPVALMYCIILLPFVLLTHSYWVNSNRLTAISMWWLAIEFVVLLMLWGEESNQSYNAQTQDKELG